MKNILFLLSLVLLLSCTGGDKAPGPKEDAEFVMGIVEKNYAHADSDSRLSIVHFVQNANPTLLIKSTEHVITQASVISPTQIAFNSDKTVLTLSGDPRNYYLTTESIKQINENPQPVIQALIAKQGIQTPFIHKAFVTQQQMEGKFPINPDTLCQQEAEAAPFTAGLRGTWKAVLSTDFVDARDKILLTPNTPITLATDGIVVQNSLQLWSGTLQRAINILANGTQVTSFPAVWTGSNSQTTGLDNNCSNWEEKKKSESGVIGDCTKTDSTWFNNQLYTCERSARVYCINSNE